MIHTLKKLPVDISSFPLMRKGDYLYIDKTKQIYDTIMAARLFFLSRPRRFGKTLLISTFEELFLGNRKLFTGLWIDASDYEWQKHPVIRLDFSGSSDLHIFSEKIAISLRETANKYDIVIEEKLGNELMMARLMRELSKANQVVILIDEYDYPLLKNISNPEEAIKIRTVIQNFFATIKANQEHVRFLFITGISKFSKTSLFSGLNNLIDLSQSKQAADLLGYTQAELDTYYDSYLEVIASEEQRSLLAIKDTIKIWYNGYRFSESPIKVYNPFSINLACFKKKLSNFWIESGTPTFLVTLLGKMPVPLQSAEGVRLKETSMSSIDVNSIPLEPLLFQAGYLTISDYDSQTREYTLHYPNAEVREAFKDYLLSAFAHAALSDVELGLARMRKAFDTNNIELLCDTLRILFANIPYQLQIPQERYYHSLFQMIGTMMKLDMQSEVSVESGRIDLVVRTKNYLYVIELKFDVPATQALQQIMERRYYEKYKLDNRQLILVGITFSRKRGFLWVEYATNATN